MPHLDGLSRDAKLSLGIASIYILALEHLVAAETTSMTGEHFPNSTRTAQAKWIWVIIISKADMKRECRHNKMVKYWPRKGKPRTHSLSAKYQALIWPPVSSPHSTLARLSLSPSPWSLSRQYQPACTLSPRTDEQARRKAGGNFFSACRRPGKAVQACFGGIEGVTRCAYPCQALESDSVLRNRHIQMALSGGRHESCDRFGAAVYGWRFDTFASGDGCGETLGGGEEKG